jgi:hypothetical protein
MMDRSRPRMFSIQIDLAFTLTWRSQGQLMFFEHRLKQMFSFYAPTELSWDQRSRNRSTLNITKHPQITIKMQWTLQIHCTGTKLKKKRLSWIMCNMLKMRSIREINKECDKAMSLCTESDSRKQEINVYVRKPSARSSMILAT